MGLNLLFVFLGGGTGAISRFLLSETSHLLFKTSRFGTFTVNILGCLAVGYLLGMTLMWQQSLSPRTKLFLEIGFLGGFTTFSTFSKEAIELLLQGRFLHAAVYLSGTLSLGLLLTFGGLYLAQLQAKL